jgi:hypothetical protein
VLDYRRTPYLGLLYAAAIGFVVTWLLETPDRPMTALQTLLFYAVSYPPGLGLAMLGDPAPHRARAEYLKVDFYAPKDEARRAG